ncbi:MAG: hypothetical protein ACLT74_01310 [Christensenellales bacterium]
MTRARGRDADMTQGNILRQYIDFALPRPSGCSSSSCTARWTVSW